MSLPVLNTRGGATPADLLRYFAKAELHWSRHVAEATELDFGVALTNHDFPGVFFANRMLNVALPDGVTPGEALSAAEAHFAAAGTTCFAWTLDPGAPDERTHGIAGELTTRGFVRQANDVMYLSGAPAGPLREVAGLRIIPARASFRHTRELFDEAAARWDHPPLAEASMLHLDDPHTDALIALRDGVAVGYVAVLAVGDAGAIEELFVSERYRYQGIGRTLLSRALETCARSQFRHVFIEVDPGNGAAKHLYESAGFSKVGEQVAYARPAPK